MEHGAQTQQHDGIRTREPPQYFIPFKFRPTGRYFWKLLFLNYSSFASVLSVEVMTTTYLYGIITTGINATL